MTNVLVDPTGAEVVYDRITTPTTWVGDTLVGYSTTGSVETLTILGTIEELLITPTVLVFRSVEADEHTTLLTSYTTMVAALGAGSIWRSTLGGSMEVVALADAVATMQKLDVDSQGQAELHLWDDGLGLVYSPDRAAILAVDTLPYDRQIGVWHALVMHQVNDLETVQDPDIEDHQVMELNGTLSPGGIFVFSNENDPEVGNIPPTFWDGAQFVYTWNPGEPSVGADVTTQLYWRYLGSDGPIGGDSINDGTTLTPPNDAIAAEWTNAWLHAIADIDDGIVDALYLSFFLSPGGFSDISESISTAKITNTVDIVAVQPQLWFWPRTQYTITPDTELNLAGEETSGFSTVPASSDTRSAWFRGIAGYWTSVTGEVSHTKYFNNDIKQNEEEGHTAHPVYTVAMHFYEAPGESITGELALTRRRFV